MPDDKKGEGGERRDAATYFNMMSTAGYEQLIGMFNGTGQDAELLEMYSR